MFTKQQIDSIIEFYAEFSFDIDASPQELLPMVEQLDLLIYQFTKEGKLSQNQITTLDDSLNRVLVLIKNGASKDQIVVAFRKIGEFLKRKIAY